MNDLFGGDGGSGGAKKGQKVFLLALAVLGVFLLLIGHIDFGGGDPNASPVGATSPPIQQQSASVQARLQIQAEEEYLASRLQALLQQISGVGEVEVSVRLEGSTTSEYAVNHSTGRKVSDESDQAGTTRVTTDVSETGQLVVVRGDRGYEIPVVEREVAPRVVGVLVVAEGARNPQIKAELFRAIRIALGVEPHKILVLPKKL
ncbi:MAG: hypothetical protein IBX71_03415 [Candidatus Desulforudis sp.]|nr:hypothetical protein [Desulforudis sp.]